MKPVLLYLAIVFFITASCPDIMKDDTYLGMKNRAISDNAPSEKIIKSDCEEKIKAIPLLTERFTGKTAEAILEKSPRLFDPETATYPSNYRTKIKQAMEAGVNFAGKYVVAEWGIGTDSLGLAIINGETGRIISYGLKANEGFDFSISSAVLIVNPKQNFQKLRGRDEVRAYSKAFKRDFYKVENDSLILICSETANVGLL